jgi:hypothetical protein
MSCALYDIGIANPCALDPSAKRIVASVIAAKRIFVIKTTCLKILFSDISKYGTNHMQIKSWIFYFMW